MSNGPAADLTNDLAFTLQLLDNTWTWRQRLVESFEYGSTHHVRVISAYQIEFPTALLQPFMSGQDVGAVRALVPISTRPKEPLLGFEARGPGSTPAPLLERTSIAAIQARYLSELLSGSPAERAVPRGLVDLFEAIGRFTPRVFLEFLVRELPSWKQRLARSQYGPDIVQLANGGDVWSGAIAAYLSGGLGVYVHPREVKRVLGSVRSAGELLAGALGEPPDPLSSSECVLLALPELAEPPCTWNGLRDLVEKYCDLVSRLSERGDEYTLVALAEYGRRWQVILELTLPLHEPSAVRLSEERTLEFGRVGWSRQVIALGDARSYHLQARVIDHSLRIAGFTVRTLADEELPFANVEGLRHTNEYLALYSAVPERPYYAEVGVRIGSSGAALVRSLVIVGLSLVSAVVAGLVPADEQLVGKLSVLLIPTTFAAALLLVREETSLARDIRRSTRFALVVSLTALWTVTISRMLSNMAVHST